jgi:hypothetical protein
MNKPGGTEWLSQGCPACRRFWEGDRATGAVARLGSAVELHCQLYRCLDCNSYWEELERFAHAIDDAKAAVIRSDPSFAPASIAVPGA